MAKLWVGVDIGKAHHHVAAVEGDGRLVFSRKVDNDERDILMVIAEVGAVGRPVCWAVDVTTGLAALLLTLLWRRQTEVRYVSGTVAFHMAAAFAGENKTDARDAVVIAHTVRMRPDIPVLQPTDRLLAELKVLTGHRADLIAQRVATLFRLQALLTASARRWSGPPTSTAKARSWSSPAGRPRPRSATPASTGSKRCCGVGSSATPPRSPRSPRPWSPPPTSRL